MKRPFSQGPLSLIGISVTLEQILRRILSEESLIFPATQLISMLLAFGLVSLFDYFKGKLLEFKHQKLLSQMNQQIDTKAEDLKRAESIGDVEHSNEIRGQIKMMTRERDNYVNNRLGIEKGYLLKEHELYYQNTAQESEATPATETVTSEPQKAEDKSSV
ncbi:hypothetical protein [Alteromonas sp. a30]|uniref:hypothetical protein n=1 Tax=Alteromonas sp. a30 TaxID=2730917 RepID=UPI00227DA2DB|nr:hypothetical protein [Alteromonas sp. a30]MCY7296623.1 hypothetical protein [Alteromonas sp. a30]